jgi:hypothetical protein
MIGFRDFSWKSKGSNCCFLDSGEGIGRDRDLAHIKASSSGGDSFPGLMRGERRSRHSSHCCTKCILTRLTEIPVKTAFLICDCLGSL